MGPLELSVQGSGWVLGQVWQRFDTFLPMCYSRLFVTGAGKLS